MIELNKNINWFPGHMKKTFDTINENLKTTTLIIECIDARIPKSSRNPVLYEKIKNKVHITVYTKIDLIENKMTLSSKNAFKINANNGEGIKALQKYLKSFEKNDKEKEQRIMIVGIPNSGKSSLINRLVNKKKAGVGDKPGFTKKPQWVKYSNRIYLLDTPGILWPKIETKKQAENLAITGAIKSEVIDEFEIAIALIKRIISNQSDEKAFTYLLEFAKKRGFLLKGGKLDFQRAAFSLLTEYRKGRFADISLDN
ncbi:MAG: ribosome biogenesis GTPase YlqF [Clostridiales Family XIII bacterium]|jgi:ribosome biogenesis GTPase A|nr:ribosome biogenesis GTPase YlqF [Clostridiales Family XIII bacterium]